MDRSNSTLPERRCPKWKSSPTAMTEALRQPTRTSVTNSSAGSFERVLVEVHDQRVVDPGGASSSSFWSRSVSSSGADSGRTTLGRVPVEGDHRGAQAASAATRRSGAMTARWPRWTPS